MGVSTAKLWFNQNIQKCKMLDKPSEGNLRTINWILVNVWCGIKIRDTQL